MARVRWLPCIAAVEWHSGGRALERPVALRLGEERVVVSVEDAWVAGAGNGGAPVERVFVVRDPAGRRWRVRVRGSGPVRVDREDR